MNLSTAKKALKAISKTYQLEKPLTEILTAELWDQLDTIIDTVLLLEDRIHKIESYAHLMTKEAE